jgi:hypothetical protein
VTPMILTMVDSEGREWFAAAYVDTLKGNGRTVELDEAQHMGLTVTDMRVVVPPVPQGMDL